MADMPLHVQEISESTSSIAEHDLSDLVPTYSPAHLQLQQQQQQHELNISNGYFQTYSGSSTPFSGGVVARPPRAIVYAASTAAHSNTSSQHPISLIPTVSPPRYQLSLSHPGTPPSRNANHYHHQTGTRRVESYPPEARRAPPSPPLSQYSAPTILQQQHSIAAYDVTWDNGSASRAVSVPGRMPRRNITPESLPLPEYEIPEDAEHDPVSNEQHSRITKEQYRLGVGYDEHIAGTVGKRISDQRRLERLKALEREFGRVKSDTRIPSLAHSPESKGDYNEAKRKISDRSSKDDLEKARHNGSDETNSANNVEMTFKEMRIKAKEERNTLNQELGITKDGNLLTQGRKLRLTLRWTQGLLGFVAVICGLGGAFVSQLHSEHACREAYLDRVAYIRFRFTQFTNPPKDENPPPSGAISTWFLYIISLGSFICTVYLFTILPCVRRSKSKKVSSNEAAQLSAGTMHNGIVLPIFSSSQGYNAIGGKKGGFGRKNKKSKKGYMMYGQQQPMTVNLVMDPNMLKAAGFSGSASSKPPSRYDDFGIDEEDEEFRAMKINKIRNELEIIKEEEEGYSENDDHDFDIPNSEELRRKKQRRRDNQPFSRMMDTMSIMKLQDKWREARRRMKKLALLDATWSIIWLAEAFFAIGFGGSCKPGSAAGW